MYIVLFWEGGEGGGGEIVVAQALCDFKTCTI